MLQMIKELPPLDKPKKIRIKFSKGGDLIYISHLDLVRTMTRAIIRARIPVKYTEGYNPIPKLVFSTPLSIGCASVCEYLDIKIDREMSCNDIKNSLSKQFPGDMSVLDVYEPNTKFSDAVYSGYTIEIFDRSRDNSALELLKECFSRSEIRIIKRSKSGDKEVDILPFVFSYDMKLTNRSLVFNTVLSSSSADYLNPEYVVNIIYDTLGLSKDDYASDCGYTITRTELYTKGCDNIFR